MHPAFVLELEEQPVPPGGWELRRERHKVVVAGAIAAGVFGRVGSQEPEVPLAQRDQMAAGAEVGLGVDDLAVAADRELEYGSCPASGTPVASDFRTGIRKARSSCSRRPIR